MNKSIIAILISFFIFNSTFACSCATPKSLEAIQNFEFENSDIVFIGDVISIDEQSNCFVVKVIETFKGSLKDKITTGYFDDICGPYVSEKGQWLFYTRIHSDNKIQINSCGITRSLKNPQSNITAAPTPPRPPAPNQTESKEALAIKREIWISIAKKDLLNEILTLRLK